MGVPDETIPTIMRRFPPGTLNAGMEKEVVPSGMFWMEPLDGHCSEPFGSAPSRTPRPYDAFDTGAPPDHVTVFATLAFQVLPDRGAERLG
jgi:hypothetical protein